MLRRLIVLVAASAPTIGAGCSLFFDADDLGSSSSALADGGVEGGASDAGDAGVESDASGPGVDADNGCPSKEGPSMVRIDDFCIDSTEVTRAQYARFVDAVGADAGGPAVKFCPTTNKSIAPLDPEKGFPPVKESPDFPVRAIDWCDAKAYCLWAGKDLCGGLGGAAITSADAVDPTKSQWAKACTRSGALRFGYADTYASGKCVEGTAPSQPTDRKCEGGYPGLFDMVGNVAEWIDACREAPYTNCALVGRVGEEIASCTTVESPPGDIPWGNVGVRCCAPAKK
jgi:formylglycine-generating enzyme required for sulfatase activity